MKTKKIGQGRVDKTMGKKAIRLSLDWEKCQRINRQFNDLWVVSTKTKTFDVLGIIGEVIDPPSGFEKVDKENTASILIIQQLMTSLTKAKNMDLTTERNLFSFTLSFMLLLNSIYIFLAKNKNPKVFQHWFLKQEFDAELKETYAMILKSYEKYFQPNPVPYIKWKNQKSN